jgi:hypothetical protein
MTLYKRIFENAIEKLENPQVNPEVDAQAFEQGFDNEDAYQDIEREGQNITPSPEEIDAIVQKSKIYNEKISNFIGLLNKIQQDVLQGQYRNIQAKGLDKFSNIIKDLQELGTDLTAGVNDALIKQSNQE